MPKSGKLKVKKQESGLQRIDTLFVRVNKTTEKRPACTADANLASSEDRRKSSECSAQKVNKCELLNTEMAPIFPMTLKKKMTLEEEKCSEWTEHAANGVPEPFNNNEVTETDAQHFDGRSTPPTPPLPPRKKLKSEETIFRQTGTESPLETPSKHYRPANGALTTPGKSNSTKWIGPVVDRMAFSTPRKKRNRSAFGKFPIRKTTSAPDRFKSLQTADPYYLANFKFIVYSIFNDKFYDYLFNVQDRIFVAAFRNLSREAKMLYIRLFQRKLRWLRISSISYVEIGRNLQPILDELLAVQFVENQNSLVDLKDALILMPAPDLKDLAKEFHVNIGSRSKEDIVDKLISHSRKPNLATMFGSKVSIGDKMCEKAKEVLGHCCRVCREPRDLFSRCISLFSLTSTAHEEDEFKAQKQIYTLLQINHGILEYPDYVENRQTKIHYDRSAFIEFQDALSLNFDIIDCMSKHYWDRSMQIYRKAEKKYTDYTERRIQLEYELALPTFLSPFTAGAVYVRLLNHGVDVLQKIRQYREANELLERLLSQSMCTKYRGMWYDRLALNYESHLKNHSQALDVIKRGLEDPAVQVAWRLGLYKRAERICSSRRHKNLKSRFAGFSHPPVTEIPSITINGLKMSTTSGKMSKSSFIKRVKTSGEVTEHVELCSVEQVALEYYQELGYSRGLNAEGAPLQTLMMIYLWDIVFSPLPDVFYNQYQTAPLDLYTDDFYDNRKEALEGRLAWLKDASAEDLTDELGKKWKLYEGIVCFGVHWHLFLSLKDAQSLVRCLGGRFLSLVFRRHVTSMRHCRSGVPDLLVWNVRDNSFKIVEVKGPGDRLSNKQILWLDYYLSIGADAEVCHVQAKGAKKLKRKKTETDSDD